MKSRIALISPPLFDTRAPHLAAPILAAELNRQGHRAEVLDFNIEAVNWLLEPPRLLSALRESKRRRDEVFARAETAVRNGHLLSRIDQYSLIRALSIDRCDERLCGSVIRALRTLRDPEAFFKPAAHRSARMLIDSALDLVGFAHDDLTRISLCPQQYNRRFRVSYMADILEATSRKCADLFLPFFDQIAVPRLQSLCPDFVGISIANVYQAIPGLTLARMLHEEGTFVVVGGTFFSKFGPEIQQRPEFFNLCSVLAITEGEDIVNALAKEGPGSVDLERLPNVLVRRDGRVIATSTNLAREVPDPGAADFRTLDLAAYHIPEPVLPIYLGKGCAWGKCTFCEIPQINRDFGRWRRRREPASVAMEMEEQCRRHGARHFVFTDEDLEAKLLGQVAAEIENRNLKANYIGFTRFSNQHTSDLFLRLARSGCRKLLFGLESGCQKVNDASRKGIDLKRVPDILYDCQAAGLAAHVFTIVGLPGEGREEARESADYFRGLISRLDLPSSSLSVSPFYLNWNSWLRRHSAEAGISYTDDQDFPVHIDEFQLPGGTTNVEFDVCARDVYRDLCWNASWAGFDIDYSNPLWPGWEEYSLLYLSRYGHQPTDNVPGWPRDLESFLSGVVSVTEGLRLREYSLDPSEPLTLSERKILYALAPASSPVRLDDCFRGLPSIPGEMKIAELLLKMGIRDSRDQSAARTVATIIRLLNANALEWKSEIRRMDTTCTASANRSNPVLATTNELSLTSGA